MYLTDLGNRIICKSRRARTIKATHGALKTSPNATIKNNNNPTPKRTLFSLSLLHQNWFTFFHYRRFYATNDNGFVSAFTPLMPQIINLWRLIGKRLRSRLKRVIIISKSVKKVGDLRKCRISRLGNTVLQCIENFLMEDF